MSGQTKRGSAVEACLNVAIGYGVALVSQLVVFPFYGIHVPLSTNIEIGAWFTVISLVRSYILRRWFNRITTKHSIQSRYSAKRAGVTVMVPDGEGRATN